MVHIENNVITITRGDTLDTNVSIKTADGEDYIPAEGDVIRFEAEDTKLLDARSAPYVYDIQINMANGTVDTFIDRGKFYVTDEVD